MTLAPSSPANPDQAYFWRVMIQTGLFAILVLILAYFTLVRPFTTGFDLASVMRGQGVGKGTLMSQSGEPLQNKIEGVSILMLQGEHAGSFAELDALEQVLGQDRPTLHGLIIQGGSNDGFEIDTLQPGETPGTFTAEQGVNGRFGGQEFVAESVSIDEAQGNITTQGETRIFTDEVQIETSQGAEISRNGDVRIGEGTSE